jgi:hypothetical protein
MEGSAFIPGHSVRLSSDARLPLAISIFYHDVPAAGKAAALMNRLTEKFGSELEVDINLWSFDVLRINEVLDAAMRRTAETDLLVISTAAAEEIPVHARDCLEGTLLLRGNRNIAIVALFDSPDSANQPARDYLKGLCRNPEDSFFCTYDPGLNDCGLTPDRMRQRATAGSSVLDTIMNRPLPGRSNRGHL